MISYRKLWNLLEKRHLTPRDLCRLSGISPSTLRALQKGDAVRLDVLERLCRGLGVDIGDVCGFREHL